MASTSVGDFSVVDINDDQPKKGHCTIQLCDGSIKKKTSKCSVQQEAPTSLRVTVRLDTDKSLEFKVKKLPGEIAENPEVKVSDGKVTLKLKKKESKSWAAYASDNLECDQ